MALAAQPQMPRVWRAETKPHKFCPGCGHGIILKALGEAIDALGIQERTIFGCDIGCSLLSWDFFNLDTIQTHHGRTTPVLVGIKRVRPELVVVSYMGDGGAYAIGAQHLVSSAVRNDLVTIIVVNNTQYGMTGGQMAPTTLPGQKTETTPYGRDVKLTGRPILGPELVAAVAPPGAYVARGSIANVVQLKNFIQKGLLNQIEGRGIAFIEALSACPTNWRTNAAETWRFIEKEMAAYFPTGELRTPGEAKNGQAGEGTPGAPEH
ncbi:MAG: 2-oxoglutarate/2-oxoacid ferredoxin oxidoreductase subunit beta [Moorella sp. (in: firmicutes)]|uniref:2-oxoglutarate oxidoreductase subunit KorB n=1 Tax=Neomoorella thermoacetica TaxID=1525 RepID=A0A1J5NM00_NEOTH|nr:2-oxoglutarate/2-oxoacid ferredoxin oxidoreductase subunit beta [Moorella sp. (in: firmicutes)]OIQ59336.1 2-oxoglutarate oxidoreductase subunit KorB [Moorella thermoacetica]